MVGVVFEADAAEEETHDAYGLISKRARLSSGHRLTRHVYRIGEEVTCISDQEDHTALDLWIPSYVREFQQQARPESNEKADKQAAEEDHQEDPNRLKERQRCELPNIGIVIFPRRFEKHDRNGVI